MKRGEQRAVIEITLKSFNDDITNQNYSNTVDVVRRTITKQKGNNTQKGGDDSSNKVTSTWHINGKPSGAAEVDELVIQKYHVQLANLCNFLPQDRVAKFAGLSETEKLKETEQTVENGELWEMHDDLIKRKKNIADGERKLHNHKADLEQVGKSLETLSRDATKAKEQQQWLDKANDFKKKLPWVQFEKKKQEYEKFKGEYEKCQERVKTCLKESAEAEVPLREIRELSNKMQKDKASKEKTLKDAENKERMTQRKLSDMRVEYDDKEEQLKSSNKREKEAKMSVQRLTNEIKDLEQRLSEIPDVQSNGSLEALREKKALFNKIRQERIPFETRLEEANLKLRPAEDKVRWFERQQADMDSVRGKKLNALTQSMKGRIDMAVVDKEVRELAKNLNREKKLYGPVLCEIECNVPFNQTCLQNVLGPNALSSYVVDNDVELMKALNNLFKTKRYLLSVVNQTETTPYQPSAFNDAYKRFGVTGTLESTFTAPSCVKKTLVALNRVDSIAVGDAKVLDAVKCQEMFNANLGNIITVCTSTNKYSTFKSRYAAPGESVPFEAEVMREPQVRLFGAQRNQSEINEVRRNLAEWKDRAESIRKERDEIQQKTNEMKKAEGEADVALRDEKGKLNKPKRDRMQIESRIKSVKLSKESQEQNLNLSANRDKLKKSLENLVMSRAKEAMNCVVSIDAVFAARREKNIAELKYVEARERQAHYEKIYEQVKEDGQKCIEEYNELKERKKRLIHVLKQFKDRAMEDATLTPDLQEKFVNMPETEEELMEEIKTCEDKATSIVCSNPAAMSEFNRYTQRKKDLETLISREEPRVNAELEIIGGIKQKWLPKLQRVLSKISDAFSRNCADIGMAGEVKLREAANDDFENYALDIFVKFRAIEELHALNANRQSGGERAVSTMLYLISLQDLTKCPFRVVDEINQGMDPKNERKVFKQMVDSASKPSTPQCFLLTPKLLSGLEYNDNVTVLCIFNGYRPGNETNMQKELQPFTP